MRYTGADAGALEQVVMVEALPHNANHILHSLQRNGLMTRLCTDLFVVRNAVASASGRRFSVVYDEANVGNTSTNRPELKVQSKIRNSSSSIRIVSTKYALALARRHSHAFFAYMHTHMGAPILGLLSLSLGRFCSAFWLSRSLARSLTPRPPTPSTRSHTQSRAPRIAEQRGHRLGRGRRAGRRPGRRRPEADGGVGDPGRPRPSHQPPGSGD